jgi:hypothetical protein
MMRRALKRALRREPVAELVFDIDWSNMQWEGLPGKQRTPFWRKTSDFCR